MRGCTASNNTGNGINGSAGNVTGCTAAGNGSNGIAFSGLGIGSNINGCLVRNNTGDGIEVGSQSLVAEQSLRRQRRRRRRGAGIHTLFCDNRVEDNHVTINDRGIDADGCDTLIVRNSAHGNGDDYAIAFGNNDAAVLAPGAAFASTQPWTNFIR